MADRVWHYVKGNETCRIPRRHVYLDTEARREFNAAGQVQTWRLGVAQFEANEKGRKAYTDRATYKNPHALWRDVDKHVSGRSRTVVWAHNLGYDVRIADALRILPGMGWRLASHNIAAKGSWLQWRDGDRSLVMVDSASIWQQPLAVIGKWFGVGKLALPDDADSMADWELRCDRDVDILSRAVGSYLRWLELSDLGTWQLTGAGQSYAAYRHRFLTHKCLVHGDIDALAAERRAMWTGRTEAYWHGHLEHEPVEEWDLPAAYAQIAHDHPVPVRLLGELGPHTDWRRFIDDPRMAILADCTIRTAEPCTPARHDDRVLWPIGTFNTTLWSPEIQFASDCGANVSVHRGWIYRLQPALHAWATWILDGLSADDSVIPAWEKAIRKHWGRALIGRFAMTYAQWQPFGTLPTVNVRRSMLWDATTQRDGELLQVGKDVWIDDGRAEWDQSQPAITGYVMALCRVRLGRILRALGEGVALYADTDGFVALAADHDRVARVAASSVGCGLRLKRSFEGLTVWGPRQVVTGREVRIAGLPRRVERFDRSRFIGETWQSFGAALKHGNAARVVVRDGAWEIEGSDRRRRGEKQGWTTPVHIDTETEGRT